MNVSAKLINSLASMLTEEQFKEFKRKVAIENNQDLEPTFIWASTEMAQIFINRVSKKSDAIGFVTLYDIAKIIENGSWGLFFTGYRDDKGKYRKVYGTKYYLTDFAKEHDGVCLQFCKKCLNTKLHPMGFLESVEEFIEHLVLFGLLVRTEYTKDVADGKPVRCYTVNQNR